MIARFGVLAAVFQSPVLRRLSFAYLAFSVAEWSTWVAVIVVAYGRGGPGEAAIVAFVELAPAALIAPTVAALGDRHPRDRVLFATYAIQAVLMAATAVALATGWNILIVYALAAAVATMVTTSRPLHAALMPEVVGSPDQLTAANVVSGMCDSAGSLLGPLAAGILIGIGGAEAVFAAGSLASVAGSVAVLGVARRSAAHRRARAERLATLDTLVVPAALVERPLIHVGNGLGHLTAGLTAIWADRRLRAVVAVAAWATFLVGSMDIFYAVLAIDLLGLDAGGVGFVGAVGGVGAILGSVAGLLLVGRERLGVALAASAVLFGASVAAIGIAPGPVAAGFVLIASGAGSGLTYVGAQTFIQRLAGDDVMSRVFGVLHGLMMGATAFGALAVPVLIGLVGERAAFAVAGLSLPIVVGLAGREFLRRERLDTVRSADLRLLRGVPMLSPLAGPVLERLAAGAIHSQHPGGSVIVREGAPGDRFFVVADGSVAVQVGGRDAGRLGPGDAFGEIALVHDVPRTATVTAIDDVRLLGIDRDPFIDALVGQARSRTIVLAVVEERLASDGARP